MKTQYLRTARLLFSAALVFGGLEAYSQNTVLGTAARNAATLPNPNLNMNERAGLHAGANMIDLLQKNEDDYEATKNAKAIRENQERMIELLQRQENERRNQERTPASVSVAAGVPAPIAQMNTYEPPKELTLEEEADKPGQWSTQFRFITICNYTLDRNRDKKLNSNEFFGSRKAFREGDEITLAIINSKIYDPKEEEIIVTGPQRQELVNMKLPYPTSKVIIYSTSKTATPYEKEQGAKIFGQGVGNYTVSVFHDGKVHALDDFTILPKKEQRTAESK